MDDRLIVTFAALVRTMREAQKNFFKNRSQPNLWAARKAESAVDEALELIQKEEPHE